MNPDNPFANIPFTQGEQNYRELERASGDANEKSQALLNLVMREFDTPSVMIVDNVKPGVVTKDSRSFMALNTAYVPPSFVYSIADNNLYAYNPKDNTLALADDRFTDAIIIPNNPSVGIRVDSLLNNDLREKDLHKGAKSRLQNLRDQNKGVCLPKPQTMIEISRLKDLANNVQHNVGFIPEIERLTPKEQKRRDKDVAQNAQKQEKLALANTNKEQKVLDKNIKIYTKELVKAISKTPNIATQLVEAHKTEMRNLKLGGVRNPSWVYNIHKELEPKPEIIDNDTGHLKGNRM